jgi:hypothetical protein
MTRSPVHVLPARSKLWVTKRDGRPQRIHSRKIENRLERLCYGLDTKGLDLMGICFKVVDGLTAGISTSSLDTMAARACADMQHVHRDYGTLATRIQVNNLHKETSKRFSGVMELLHAKGIVAADLMCTVRKHGPVLDSSIIHARDSYLTYAGLRSLEERHLLRVEGKAVERPQHMFMRIAVALHADDVPMVLQSYDAMSRGKVVHQAGTITSARRSLASGGGQPVVAVALSAFVKSEAGAATFTFDHAALTSAVTHACKEAERLAAGGTFCASGVDWVGITRAMGSSAPAMDDVRASFESGLTRPGRAAVALRIEPGEASLFGYDGACFTVECPAHEGGK